MTKPDIEKLISALTVIRHIAMSHPAFDAIAYDTRDFASLYEEGVDTCDWTQVAIEADDALKETK